MCYLYTVNADVVFIINVIMIDIIAITDNSSGLFYIAAIKIYFDN